MTMTIDTHTHFVPTSLPGAVDGDRRWPSVDTGPDGTGTLSIGGEVFRRFDRSAWDVDQRIGDMDAEGIDVQILSPLPELLSTWLSPADGDVVSQAMNAFAAAMVDAAPTRFWGVGMVPLQAPDLAVERLRELKDLGLIGVEIPTHVDGLPIGDPTLDAVYAEIRRLDLMVMVHPLHPVGVQRAGGPSVFATALSLPIDTALAAGSLVGSGTLERHPGLRILLCHGGGAWPALMPRLDRLRHQVAPIADELPRPPSSSLSSFFFDTAVYDPRTLAHLVEIVGENRVVIGSDYPFAARQARPLEFIGDAVPATTATAIASSNPHNLCATASCGAAS